MLPFSLRDLRYVVAVADEGGFGRAARACFVSQPTLSAQVKKLEEALGATLFERNNRAVRLTPAGRSVVARARRVLEEAEQVAAGARSVDEPLTGEFRLGVISTLGPYVLPWLVKALRKGYRDLRLIVREGLTEELAAQLADHALDAVLAASELNDPRLTSRTLFEEPFFLVCSPAHRLADRREVRASELEGEGLLLLREGHCFRDQALELCGSDRREPEDFRAASLETLTEFARAGLGCTLLPAMAVEAARARGIRVIPLADAAARREVSLHWRRGYPREDSIETLARVVLKNLPPSVQRATD